jgi:hypothetical protein
MGLEVAANPSGYPNGAGIGWVFTAPSWATIAKYTIHVPDSFTYFSNAGIVGQALVQADDETDPVYDYRNLGGGSYGPITVERTPLDAVKSINVSASCDGEGGPCPANTRISRMDLASSALVLNDSTIPAVNGLAGSLISGSPLRGTVEASFTATDKGPGVYNAWFVIDGKSEPAVQLSSNNGWCVNLGQTSDGSRSFASPDPCAESVNASMALDTTPLADGQHTVKLNIDDASGNTTTAYNSTVTTGNAPATVSEPTIAGSSIVGSTLTGTAGTFSAPNGAGVLSSVQSAWLRCSDAGATHCSVIAGKSASTYEPTAADIGYYIVYSNTVSDKDGTTVADSPPTPAVSAPAKETSGQGTGQSNGGSSSGSSSGAGGAGGSSQGLTLNLVSGATLGSTSPWQVRLSVNPRRVRRGTTIRLTGSVTTSPRPSPGKLVYLRARIIKVAVARHAGKLRKIRRYGSWITFMQLRTSANGSFRATYKFRFGGRHTYQFAAVAPQEGAYLNTTGTSNAATVTEG